jgi:hypothetical protein
MRERERERERATQVYGGAMLPILRMELSTACVPCLQRRNLRVDSASVSITVHVENGQLIEVLQYFFRIRLVEYVEI